MKVIADSISVRLGGYVIERFSYRSRFEKCIYVSMPDARTLRITSVLNRLCDTLLHYMTVEGYIPERYAGVVDQYLRDVPIVGHSKYVCELLVDSGLRCDGSVLPLNHRIVSMARDAVKSGRTLGYLAGYMRRKYPDYLWDLETNNILLFTSQGNPFLRKFVKYSTNVYNATVHEVAAFYNYIDIYVNLGDAEGVGMTPAEALSFGNIVVTADLPPIEEQLPGYPLMVETNEEYRENLGYEVILHRKYKPRDMDYMINYTLETSPDERSKIIGEYRKAISSLGKYEELLNYMV